MTTKNVKEPRKVSLRKAPRQTRSKDKVNQILDAARQLLVTRGLEKLTTNHIATAANMSVGSLYQYFPNKQAILNELYLQFLGDVEGGMHVFKQRAAEVETGKLLDEIFTYLYGPTLTDPKEHKLEMELAKAMKLYPELEEIDRKHGKSMGLIFADIFRAAGVKTSNDEELEQMGIFVYCLDIALLEFYALGGDQDRAIKWYRGMAGALIAPHL